MEITIKDIDASNIDDVFRVCSHSRLEDPLQKRGMEIKRSWLTRMLEKHGSCTKIAYLDGRPVAQILYYPETADPTVAEPRGGVMAIRCTYNPFRETQKKGVSSRLLGSVLKECRDGPESLGGRPARFAVAQAFETGEGTSLVAFYASKGFQQGEGEMYLELSGGYELRKPARYEPLPEDRGRALVFYEPICEWSIGSTVKIEELLNEIAPALPVTTINSWENPQESTRRGRQQLIVNATPITSTWRDREAFTTEVKQALTK
jgi:GNAT superfamily N-acetyltransferase